jgi:hypothetical protein
MKKVFFDRVRLSGGMSLIIPHLADSLTLEQVAKKMEIEKKDTESFGLFDTASPNFATYYPGVKAEDLRPVNSDFIFPVFRALSETIVHRKFNPIDFSEGGILKASQNKLLGQTVYANHEAVVGNHIGVVSKTSWQASYETSMNGKVIPGGINAVFKIDGKSQPNIARGIMMEPPSIHSNSVTVSFKWEKSHPTMDDNEFRNKLATFGADGKLIRRVVVDISNYHETSLVAHGADPFAQRVDSNGHIVNINYATSEAELSEIGKKSSQVYFYDYKTDITSLSEDNNPPQPEIKTETIPMKDLLLRLAVFLALKDATFESLSETDMEKKINERLTALKAAETEAAKVTKLTADLGTANAEVTRLTTENTELKKKDGLATTGLAATDATRKEVIRMYNVLTPAPDAAMLTTFQNADFATLTALQKTYQTQMDEKYPGHCEDCQSTNITRNSAIIEAPKPEDTTKNGGKVKPGKPLSNMDVASQFGAPSTADYTRMHGQVKKAETAKP